MNKSGFNLAHICIIDYLLHIWLRVSRNLLAKSLLPKMAHHCL
nr:MAG TPA: hypothetical protein [Caudoviricetes sp.]